MGRGTQTEREERVRGILAVGGGGKARALALQSQAA